MKLPISNKRHQQDKLNVKTKPKKICIIRHGYYPTDPRVYKQARALADAGYQVDIICLRKSTEPGREIIDGVHVYRMYHAHQRGSIARYIMEYVLSFISMGIFLSALFFKHHHSIIQVNTLPNALVFIAILPRLFGARVLLDLHEPSPELLLTKFDNHVPAYMLKLQIVLEKLSIRFAHQAITVNDTIRQRFIDRGASPEKIAVVRNVPPTGFGENVTPPPPHDGLVIMTHGTLQPRYGQHLLLQALPLIRKQFKSLKLIVAGPGETKDELQALSTELDCDDLVTFTGLVSRTRITELISQSDIGIVPLLPNAFSELCQPNKLFEYIALKTAVVVARFPAIEESFDDSCVQYFPAGNVEELARSVIKLGQDARLRESLAGNAFARYRTLCWEVAKKHYVQQVDSLREKQ